MSVNKNERVVLPTPPPPPELFTFNDNPVDNVINDNVNNDNVNNDVIMVNYKYDYRNFYLDDNNEIYLDISGYWDCCAYLIDLQKLCENIILLKKITWNDSENKYVKCLSTVSFDWIKQTFNIDTCFGWWLEKIIKHVELLEYIVVNETEKYMKGFEINQYYYVKHPELDNDDCIIQNTNYNDFTDILYPRYIFRSDNCCVTKCYDIDYNYWISYRVKSQYKDNKVVPIKNDDEKYICADTGKPFEDIDNYIKNTSQAVLKHLYDLQQAMRNNHMTDKLTSQINAVTTKLDKFISKHKNDCEHLRMDVDTCADIIYKNMKNQKVYCDETNLYVNDLQDRISRLELLLCDNVDSQIIDRILNINKESESLEQIVKKQQQMINELQEELKKQREEFEEYKSQRQKQLAAIMSQM